MTEFQGEVLSDVYSIHRDLHRGIITKNDMYHFVHAHQKVITCIQRGLHLGTIYATNAM